MASITQTIPNYIAGISQQPEELMLPGQVKELINGLPDITDGLVKRSGTKFLSNLTGAADVGSWFSYYRDEEDGIYIGQVADDGVVRMWRLYSDGRVLPENVTNNLTPGYLVHDPGKLKFNTANDYTFVTNTETQVNMLSTLSAARNKRYEYFISLKQLVHGRAYNFEIKSSSLPNKSLEKTATTLKVQAIADTQPSSGQGYFAKNIIPAGSNSAQTEYIKYGYEDTHPDGKLTATETFIVSAADVDSIGNNVGKNLAFRLTTTAQVNVKGNSSTITSGTDYQSVYNTTVELLHGGHGWSRNDAFFVDMQGTTTDQSQRYLITVTERAKRQVHQEARFRPEPTSFEATTPIDAESILSQINVSTAFIRPQNSAITLDTEVIGNGIYIASDTEFNVTTSEPDLWSILSTKAINTSELPSQCKHGFIVEVTNSDRSAEDNYYLKFVGDNNKDGPGAWEETVEPSVPSPPAPSTDKKEIKTSIDPATLPHTIVRTPSGFIVDQFKIDGNLAWKPREVGDDKTNPIPSFVGNKISQTIFHRNRLGFLSRGNVILSQTGDLGNFFFNSALVVSPDDPIDIAASSTEPVTFTSAIETTTGLVAFAQSQQFLLHTDSDSLTPETAKLSNISTYRYNPSAKPVSMGTTIGFTDQAGENTRFFEMFDISRDREPQLIEQTKIVQTLLPSTVDHVVNSRENNTVFFLQKGTKSIFAYRYHNANNQRIQSAWFQWTFPFSIDYIFSIDDKLYIVENSSSNYFLYECYIKPYGSETTISGSGIYGGPVNYTSFLDSFYVTASNTAPSVTHTWQPGPNSPNLDNYDGYTNVVAIANGEIKMPTSIVGNVMTFDTALGGSITFGIPFQFKVGLPQVYVTKSSNNQLVADLTASLTIQRMQLRFGNIGQFSVGLKRIGKADYTKEYNQTVLNDYRVNDAPVDKVLTIAVPVYERNTNCNVSITSTHPAPLNFRSMSWEGDYSSMYHRRV